MQNLQSTQLQLFLEGQAGSGKTTAAISHLRYLLDEGIRPQSILVLVPQRTLGRPYQLAMTQPGWSNAADVDVVTIGGLARRSVDLFWPIIAEEAGFTNIEGQEPTFLTIETAQYHMAKFIDEALETGRFDSVSVSRARLIAQSLDNLSKAAINHFTPDEVTDRLTRAWGGHSSREIVYQTWLDVAHAYRTHCLENNLLDFSLQIEIFSRHILHNPQAQEYLKQQYQHLIADNIEEYPPVGLDFVRWIWDDLQSSLLIYDHDAGYRVFLGAEPQSAYQLRELCEQNIVLNESYVQSSDMQALGQSIIAAFEDVEHDEENNESDSSAAFDYNFSTFYPQMLNWVCENVIDLVLNQQVEPRDIIIIAPYLNDSLRFSVINQLEHANIPIVSHRPSRAIRDEPAARAMLTMMQLVNPTEVELPPATDVIDMLVQFIEDIDPIRATFLADIVYGVGRNELGSFDTINHTMQERITYSIGERYEALRKWMVKQKSLVSATPPDYFLRSLFGDVLSQPGYGFQTNLDSGTVAAQLVDSAYGFRHALYPEGTEDWSAVWKDYRELVSEGLLAAVHPLSWQKEEANAVFIAPAYTYLMRNRPTSYQFWLDVGSAAWAERLEQPITHPYVLRRTYPIDHIWDDEDEQAANWNTLYKLTLGLVRRCREKIYLAISDLGEQGFEQRGPLLYLFQNVLHSDTEGSIE